MHPYVPHLLEDINSAHRAEVSVEENFPPRTIEDELEDSERWMEEPTHTFGYYCGLEKINFPPSHVLTIDEMKQIISAFKKMMFSYNLSIDLPDALPLPKCYDMTIDTLNKKTQIVNSGMISFDYCSGYAPGCIFKEYCPCLKIWNEDTSE